MTKVTKLVDEIAGLTVLELSELNKALQEKLGVTPQQVAVGKALVAVTVAVHIQLDPRTAFQRRHQA